MKTKTLDLETARKLMELPPVAELAQRFRAARAARARNTHGAEESEAYREAAGAVRERYELLAAALPFPVVAAYTPGARGPNPVAHAITTTDLEMRLVRRKAGENLCGALDAGAAAPYATCVECLGRMERYARELAAAVVGLDRDGDALLARMQEPAVREATRRAFDSGFDGRAAAAGEFVGSS